MLITVRMGKVEIIKAMKAFIRFCPFPMDFNI